MKLLYQIKSYLVFLIRSTNQHGVHSPFVYNLVTKCFYNKQHYTEYQHINNYRKILLKNTGSIDVTDFGAGSKTHSSSNRNIASIAKHVGSNKARTRLLFRLITYFKPNTILELGTSLGIGTQAMALGNSKANITTIEGCPNLSNFSKSKLGETFNNITFINNNFEAALKQLPNQSFDFVFFDGNHTKKATINYFNTLLPFIHNDTVFVFDDIYWSKDMTEAWKHIIQHPKVTVSIDTFQWGFVFFRIEQLKQHFTIRV